MKRCIKCNAEISDTAKFCGICRTRQPDNQPAAPETMPCPSCGAAVRPTAKFCPSCGHRMSGTSQPTATPPAPSAPAVSETEHGSGKDFDTQRGFVTWRILPGQIAVKINERELSGYGRIRGVYVAPGTRALFFVNGKLAATLDSGRYSFRELRNPTDDDADNAGVMGFLQNIAGFITDGVSALLNLPGRPFYSVVLCKDSDFPLVYTFENIPTATIYCSVGLHFLCKIADFNEFADALLADKKFVTLDSLSAHLQPVIKTAVRQAFLRMTPQQVTNDPAVMDSMLDLLRHRVELVYPYLEPVRVISVTADNEALDRIRRLKEELYISEQELQQTQLRYDFLNRLQDAERSNQLRQARSEADFRLLVNDIARSSTLNESRANVNFNRDMSALQQDAMRIEDNQAAFVLMLSAERQLREARTKDEVDAALHKLQQSRMLRDEEIQVLKEQINHRAAMVRIDNNKQVALAEMEAGQLIALAAVRGEMAVDAEKLRWEIEVGNKRLDNTLMNERKKRQFEEEKRQSDADFQRQQMNYQMDLLRQAEAMRQAREDAKHRREMETARLNKESELRTLEVMSGMTFEQIMAANPNISPEAAKALAEKFKAQANMANMDRMEALNRQHHEDLKEMIHLSMGLARDSVQAQNNLHAARLQDRDAELVRSQRMSERSADRVLDSVRTTVSAVSGRPQIYTPAPQVMVTPPAPPAPTTVFCPNCGQKNEKTVAFCEECGTDLSGC